MEMKADKAFGCIYFALIFLLRAVFEDAMQS